VNTRIAYSPEAVAACSGNWKPTEALSFSLTAKYVGKQFLDNTQRTDHRLNEYLVNDLQAEWTPKVKGLQRLTLRGAIYNLFDQHYCANGYIYYGTNYPFPQAGRHFMAGVTVGI
jgi:iron complex outermembrane receptor protein